MASDKEPIWHRTLLAFQLKQNAAEVAEMICRALDEEQWLIGFAKIARKNCYNEFREFRDFNLEEKAPTSKIWKQGIESAASPIKTELEEELEATTLVPS